MTPPGPGRPAVPDACPSLSVPAALRLGVSPENAPGCKTRSLARRLSRAVEGVMVGRGAGGWRGAVGAGCPVQPAHVPCMTGTAEVSPAFIFFEFIYLRGTVTDREREREIERDRGRSIHPSSAGFFPNGHSSQRWARPKPAVWTPSGSPTWVAGAQARAWGSAALRTPLGTRKISRAGVPGFERGPGAPGSRFLLTMHTWEGAGSGSSAHGPTAHAGHLGF